MRYVKNTESLGLQNPKSIRKYISGFILDDHDIL